MIWWWKGWKKGRKKNITDLYSTEDIKNYVNEWYYYISVIITLSITITIIINVIREWSKSTLLCPSVRLSSPSSSPININISLVIIIIIFADVRFHITKWKVLQQESDAFTLPSNFSLHVWTSFPSDIIGNRVTLLLLLYFYPVSFLCVLMP